jgi:hypothetical protein
MPMWCGRDALSRHSRHRDTLTPVAVYCCLSSVCALRPVWRGLVAPLSEGQGGQPASLARPLAPDRLIATVTQPPRKAAQRVGDNRYAAASEGCNSFLCSLFCRGPTSIPTYSGVYKKSEI